MNYYSSYIERKNALSEPQIIQEEDENTLSSGTDSGNEGENYMSSDTEEQSFQAVSHDHEEDQGEPCIPIPIEIMGNSLTK